MGITYYEENKLFKLDTPSSTYCLAIVDDNNFIGHVYYGKRISDHNLNYLLRINEPPFVPSVNNRDRSSFLDSFPTEYPTSGIGDFRESCLQVMSTDGFTGCGLSYSSHSIYPGKKNPEGLPFTFASSEQCTTLELICVDPILSLEVTLIYNVFSNLDVITRSVRIKNKGDKELYLEKVLSACLDMDNSDFEMISLHGSWARERMIQRVPLAHGRQLVSSTRGESSHQEHPFIALIEKNGSEDSGRVYGMHFVYSGNFMAQAELTQVDSVRAVIGIHPYNFKWKLDKDDEFIAPEVVLTFSEQGIGAMTRTLHDLYRNHLIRGEYKDRKRPILINNWEATYFDFDTDKLLSIANEASQSGIEMFVLDDGWFGRRNDDNSSLGDWFVNENKLKGGLKYLVDEINKLGMAFGIWMEPEMVSPDSDLYRAHPDWAISLPGRTATLARNQYVLDMSRKEVREYVYSCIKNILQSANITYVKWDMNRPLTDVGSAWLESDRQGEQMHRYVLGVYELQERLVTEFPHVLLENCSGGGARFDPGMLYYSPQIWCSDDTDAIERLKIQQGTAMIYPLSTIGAHVSDCPNHAVGRTTPFETRGYVALAGTFGYELDVTKIPQADRAMIPDQIKMYHKYNDLIRTGDYYRISSYLDNKEFDCWQIVSKDKTESLITCVQVLAKPFSRSRRLYFKGLKNDLRYTVEDTDETFTGETLMYAGYNLGYLKGDFAGKLIYLISNAVSLT